MRDDTCRNSERKSQDTHGHTPLSGYQFGAATMIIIRYVTYVCKNMEPSSDDFVWGFFAGAESVLYGKFWILMQKTLLDGAADCHPVQYFLILNT